MPINEKLIAAAEPIARALRSPDDIRRAHRVEQAIDSQGRPILEGRDFIPIQSPDGSTWRIRVDNAGTITASKVV